LRLQSFWLLKSPFNLILCLASKQVLQRVLKAGPALELSLADWRDTRAVTENFHLQGYMLGVDEPKEFA